MPVALTYPGVYVQEVPSGVRTITGVGTSIGMFIGRARKGELYRPVQCLSYQDFDAQFTAQFAQSELPTSVRLFFQNGGTQCYVSRIADQEKGGTTLRAAAVQLLTEENTPSLAIEARSPGTFGNDIRIRVSYSTTQPESTFNMEVFRWMQNSTGVLQKADVETHLGLHMNPAHPRYAQDVLEQNSRLIRAADVSVPIPASPAGRGFSQGGRPIAANINADFRNECIALFGRKPLPARQNFQFRISVDGGTSQLIDLGDLDFTMAPLLAPATIVANLQTAIENLINARVSPAQVHVTFETGPIGQAGETNAKTKLLRIASDNGDVFIDPGPDPTTDVAGVLMLGTAQGGVEVSRWARKRPAPNGVLFRPDYFGGTNSVSFAQLPQTGGAAITGITIGAVAVPLVGVNTLNTTPTVAILNPKLFQDRNSVKPLAPPDPVSDGVREKWAIVATAIIAARGRSHQEPVECGGLGLAPGHRRGRRWRRAHRRDRHHRHRHRTELQQQRALLQPGHRRRRIPERCRPGQ
ncbi:hypothetical protein LP415_01980 [Polaromonas sp. P1(28)-8]|nr:hypothetical protein LP415_01980 [Polaromonas sp. P1(28)-8]